MKIKKTYTEPKLWPKNEDMSKDWFILVRFYNPETNKWVARHFKEGLNRLHTLTGRREAASGMIKQLKELLANGMHPFIKSEKAEEERNLLSALTFALSQCRVSDATMKGYRLLAAYAGAAAVTIKLHDKPIKEIKRKEIKLLLEQCRAERKWSDKSYNKYLGYLKALFSQLVEWEEIEYNPVHKIKTLTVEETQKFVPYTDEEKRIIREYLYLQHYRFFVFLMMIYHTGLRPMEVLALKVKDLHLEKRLIVIIPDKIRRNSKTKTIREIPLNDFLQPLLREHVEGVTDPNLFIFGSPFKFRGGYRREGTGHQEYFNPNLNRIKRDTVTKLWKTIVKDKLKIDKYLYAAKHTGADDKIMAGVDLDALRDMYGHSSKFMTARYATRLKEVYRKEINEKSPAF